MPLTPQTADLISQGTNGLFGFIGDLVSRKYNQRMYEKQRTDALTDWNMQNQYNSPAAQMERLKAAGLNPNLVYGDGGATMASAPIRQSQAQDWHPSEKKIDLGSNAMMGYDIKIKQAQLDNINQDTEVKRMDELLRDSQIRNLEANAGKLTWDTKRSQGLYGSDFEYIKQKTANLVAGTKKIGADTDYTIHQDARQAQLTQSTLNKQYEEILSLRKGRAKTDADIALINRDIQNKQTENWLKLMDVEMRKQGMQPHDAAWQRVLIQASTSTLEGIKELYQKIKTGMYRLGH
nr:MAG: DNA pilot protein [Microviridae sp.]